MKNEKLFKIVDAYHNDYKWLNTLQGFIKFDDKMFGEFFACRFRDSCFSTNVCLPAWASASEEEYNNKCEHFSKLYGWDRYYLYHNLFHLSIMARDEYKRDLHRQWLESLQAAISPGTEFLILDYGSGTDSFGELAMIFPDARVIAADIDTTIIDFIKYRSDRCYSGRVEVLQLKRMRPPLCDLAREHIDFRSVKGNFDAIVLADVLEHMLDPFAALIYLYGLLRPGGIILVNYPHNIEGDWHTPESYYLHKWCMKLLSMGGRRLSENLWIKDRPVRSRFILITFLMIQPLLQWRARKFALNYIRLNGNTLIEQVKLSGRDLTIESLLASV